MSPEGPKTSPPLPGFPPGPPRANSASRTASRPPSDTVPPRLFYLNIYQLSSWSRALLVPLTIISTKRPPRAVPPSATLHELVAAHPPRPKRTAWTSFFYAVDALVKRMEKLPYGRLREIALQRAERWTMERLEDSDGLGAVFPPIRHTHDRP